MDYQKLEPPVVGGDWAEHERALEQHRKELAPTPDEVKVPGFWDAFKQVIIFNLAAGAIFGAGHFLGIAAAKAIRDAAKSS